MTRPQPERVAAQAPPTPDAELKRVLRRRTRSVRGTQLLFAANIGLFAVMATGTPSIMFLRAPHLIAWGAGFGPRTINGEWWRLLTATFLHGGLAHLTCNMLGLLTVGRVLERLVGTRAFVLFYLACGLAGSAASLWTHPFVTSVGASGAIMGMYGMLVAVMIAPRHRSRAPDAGDLSPIRVPRHLLQIHLRPAIGCILSTLFLGWQLPIVDNAAHVGGLAAGCLIGSVAGRDIEWRTPGRRQLLMALALGVACCGAAVGLAGRLQDLRPLMIRVFESESRARIRYSNAAQAKTDPATLSSLIDREIRPALAVERTALATLGTVATVHRQILVDLRRYVALRDDAWDHRARGLRQQRADLLRRSKEIDDTADIVMRRLLRAPVQ